MTTVTVADIRFQVVTNDISSTKVRLLLKRDMSIDYLYVPSNSPVARFHYACTDLW